MSRVDAWDVVVTSVGSKVGVGSTAATSTNQLGEVNVSGVLLGGAQAVHSVVDLSSKGMQATFASTWGKAVPGLGGVLGLTGLALAGRDGVNSRSDYAGVVSNGLGVVAAGAVLVGASPVIAGAAATGAIIAGGYQIYSAITDRPLNASYSNEGRNYQTPTYNFGPNHRGNGFTDPRILDNSGGYRGLNTYSGVYASQAAENAAFERDWNTALNAYSTEPSYTSFPTAPGAYKGLEDAFGAPAPTSNPSDFGDLDTPDTPDAPSEVSDSSSSDSSSSDTSSSDPIVIDLAHL